MRVALPSWRTPLRWPRPDCFACDEMCKAHDFTAPGLAWVGGISTEALIEKLVEDKERPWATWAKGGKPITANHLWRLLRKYGIASEDVYPNGVRARGYKRVRFEEAWERYLMPKKTFSKIGRASCREGV